MRVFFTNFIAPPRPSIYSMSDDDDSVQSGLPRLFLFSSSDLRSHPGIPRAPRYSLTLRHAPHPSHPVSETTQFHLSLFDRSSRPSMLSHLLYYRPRRHLPLSSSSHCLHSRPCPRSRPPHWYLLAYAHAHARAHITPLHALSICPRCSMRSPSRMYCPSSGHA